MKVTLEQIKQHPANFMYLWADEQKFLRYINPKYAKIIAAKKENQKKLLYLSCGENDAVYNEWLNTIDQAFVDAYNMHPYEALVVLAQGGQVAGKNWEEGVFGVGAVTEFAIRIDDQAVTVDPATGHIFLGGQDITDTNKTVYANIKNQTVAYQLFSTEQSGFIFMSQYIKTTKKYRAQSYADGQYTYNARTGNEINASDNADIWGAILLSIEKVIEWIISLFGGNTNTTPLSPANTLPSQTEDGFVQEAGLGSAGMIALALVAGGTLLMTAKGKKTLFKNSK